MVCLPVASVSGTFLVELFAGSQLAMFLAPCAIGGFFILLFAVTLDDRRLAEADKPSWSRSELAGTFYFRPRKSPDFAWVFASRFMFVLAYAFLITDQAYYLLEKIGSAEADVPQQIFLGTLTQSGVVIAASLISGKLSDRAGRRKIFVLAAAIIYGLALIVVATAGDFSGFVIGMAISGLGFGMYVAVDLAGALPFALAPAIAPAILAIGGGSYGALYGVAAACALIAALAIVPVKGARWAEPAPSWSRVAEPVQGVEDQVEPEHELGRVVVAGRRDVATDHLDEVGILGQHGVILVHLALRLRREVVRAHG